MESDVITLQDIFVAKPPDEDAARPATLAHLLSPLACTGLKPHFLEKMAANGVVLPPTLLRARGDRAAGRPSPRGTADELEAKRIRIRVGIALGAAALCAVRRPRHAGVKVVRRRRDVVPADRA